MDKSKRNLAKALGVAGAAFTAWKKPDVDSVMLPAHAVTSCVGGCYQSVETGSSIFWDTANEELRFHSDVTDCSNEPKQTFEAIVSETEPAEACGLWDTLNNVAADYDEPCTVWYCDTPI